MGWFSPEDLFKAMCICLSLLLHSLWVWGISNTWLSMHWLNSELSSERLGNGDSFRSFVTLASTSFVSGDRDGGQRDQRVIRFDCEAPSVLIGDVIVCVWFGGCFIWGEWLNGEAKQVSSERERSILFSTCANPLLIPTKLHSWPSMTSPWRSWR